MVDAKPFNKEVNTNEHVKKHSNSPEVTGELSKKINSLASNLKMIEERFSTLKNKSQVSEKEIIEIEKDFESDMRIITDDVVEVKRQVRDISDKLRLMSQEIKNLAGKDDLKIIERYVDMWQPMDFVTRKELERMIEEKLKEKS
jgi:predicted nucleic acid-binding protein